MEQRRAATVAVLIRCDLIGYFSILFGLCVRYLPNYYPGLTVLRNGESYCDATIRQLPASPGHRKSTNENMGVFRGRAFKQ